MIKEECKTQFAQSWKIFESIVDGYEDNTWLDSGCGYMTPARIAFHILLGVEYYIEYTSDLTDKFNGDWASGEEAGLPRRKDILHYISIFRDRVDIWIDTMSLDGDNPRFPWAGKTRSGVLVFLLRHVMYHIGELNAMLYQRKNGGVDDFWMMGFRE